MSTDAYTTTAIDMLKAGAPVDDIAAQTGMSKGEIAALAEAEGLTREHTRQALAELLEALAWGEEHDTKKVRTLAARARTALTELTTMRRTAAQVSRAEAEVTALKQQLAEAENKLRAAKTGTSTSPTTSTPESKKERDKIRAWARRNGYQVAAHGLISQEIRNAWNNRDQAPELQRAE
ncbi:Lsr2 family DNA-binding protein [Streptomyces violaceusniger]|uniref:Lsr2 family DNA-binding protein n=1 Tax=Streptomyces violaceusniger TaxID=68280 RepID=UPI0031E32370